MGLSSPGAGARAYVLELTSSPPRSCRGVCKARLAVGVPHPPRLHLCRGLHPQAWYWTTTPPRRKILLRWLLGVGEQYGVLAGVDG